MRLSLALLAASFAIVSCHDSSGSSPFLALGVNDVGAAESLLAFADGIAAVAVPEQGVDRNGDGDGVDLLLEILDVRSGKRVLVSNVATGSGVTAGAGLVSFLVDEAAAGRDLDGDGDEVDVVAHVHDALRGSTRNLGLATFHRIVQEGALIAVGAHEGPGVDLNGDGDFHDVVVHVYEAEHRRMTTLPSDTFGDTLRIQRRRVLCVTDGPEAVQIYDVDTRQLTTIDQVVDLMWVEGSLLAFIVPEWENGFVDLNGNGRTTDVFVELRDLDTGVVRATSESDCGILALGKDMAVVYLEKFPEPAEIRVYDRFSDTLSDPLGRGLSHLGNATLSDRRHAYLVDEAEVGDDLDGDGRAIDRVLHVFDARTGTTRSIGRASFSDPEIDAQRVAFLGLGTPREERPPSHTSVHLLNLATGVVTDLGLMASAFRLVGGRILALSPEAWLGEDLDGDEELTHSILHVHELDSGETLDTGLAAASLDQEFEPVLLDGDVLALVVDGRLKAIRLR